MSDFEEVLNDFTSTQNRYGAESDLGNKVTNQHWKDICQKREKYNH